MIRILLNVILLKNLQVTEAFVYFRDRKPSVAFCMRISTKKNGFEKYFIGLGRLNNEVRQN